ncbi:MAG: alpha/beta fold hydrolase [Candidatus Aminicenantales bacterium]
MIRNKKRPVVWAIILLTGYSFAAAPEPFPADPIAVESSPSARPSSPADDIVGFNKESWIFGDDTEVVSYAGRTALTGTAYLKNVALLNGTVEVDVLTTGERNFGGIMFRVQSFREYEWCWVRMHKANGLIPDGVQHAPAFNGTACWQLNGGPGGMAPVNVPRNEWVHMKIEILNDTAELYVKDMVHPVMVMDNLQLGLKKGSVGLRTNFSGSLYFSNFSYRIKMGGRSDPPEEKPMAPDILADWRLSPAYKVDDFSEIESYPAGQLAEAGKWIKPEVENSGLVNITKYYGHEEGTPPTCVILRTIIDAEEEKIVKMNFGYSDAVALFLNGRPLFAGNSAYRSRNMAYGGWISYNDAVFLSLKQGKNELLAVIAEEFGGCGFQAKISGSKGVDADASSPRGLKYGIDENAGRYVNTGDAQIYCEVYGEGKPVVLLHGGFAYIDQFKNYIPVLSRKFKVIAVATRGYGKSELGTRKYSYDLLAEDVKAVIQKECREKAIIIGFSDGSNVAYLMARRYPELVDKIVVMGGALGISGYSKEGLDWLKNFSSREFESYRPDFKKMTPQPARWSEFIESLRSMWATPQILPFDDLRIIECPVLMLYGDRDFYCSVEHIAQIYKNLRNAQLVICPNSGHVDVSPRNMTILERHILKYIEGEG